MRIAAVSDIHSPRYLQEFSRALAGLHHPDVLLLAGDMIEGGRWSEYGRVAEAIAEALGDMPTVACFGNDEQGLTIQKVQEIVNSRISFLAGDTKIVKVEKQYLGLLGVPLLDVSRAERDWMVTELFEKRIHLLSRCLRALREKCDRVIVLMHYSPLSPQSFPPELIWWLARAFENDQPDVIVHGHVHYSTNPNLEVDGVRIVNVAFPGAWRLTEFSI